MSIRLSEPIPGDVSLSSFIERLGLAIPDAAELSQALGHEVPPPVLQLIGSESWIEARIPDGGWPLGAEVRRCLTVWRLTHYRRWMAVGVSISEALYIQTLTESGTGWQATISVLGDASHVTDDMAMTLARVISTGLPVEIASGGGSQ